MKRSALDVRRGEVCDDCPAGPQMTRAQSRAFAEELARKYPVRVPPEVWLVFRPSPLLGWCCAVASCEKVAREIVGRRPGHIIVGPLRTGFPHPNALSAWGDPLIP